MDPGLLRKAHIIINVSNIDFLIFWLAGNCTTSQIRNQVLKLSLIGMDFNMEIY